MAPIPELLEQLRQATGPFRSQLPPVGSGLATVSTSGVAELPSKPDQDSNSEDHASTGSGSRSPESTQEFQPSKAVGDELATRLMIENAKLTRRIDDIETRLSKRIDELSADLPGKLSQRVDDLEEGMSVVIHDLLNLRRKIEPMPQQEDAELKIQKLNDAIQGLTVDVCTCKVVLTNFFGVNKLTSTLGLKDAPVDGPADSPLASNTPIGSQPFTPLLKRVDRPAEAPLASNAVSRGQSFEHSFRVNSSLQGTPGMSKTAPVVPMRCGETPDVRSSLSQQRIDMRASPRQSKLSSYAASPVRMASPHSFSRADDECKTHAGDMMASPVHFREQPMPQGSVQTEAVSFDPRASPDTHLTADETVQGEAQLLDRMIAESEKTLGKIKMIAASKGLAVSPQSDGKGSVSVPVGRGSTNLPGAPPPTFSRVPPSISQSAPRSRVISVAHTPKRNA